jgi:hypothetical protein
VVLRSRYLWNTVGSWDLGDGGRGKERDADLRERGKNGSIWKKKAESSQLGLAAGTIFDRKSLISGHGLSRLPQLDWDRRQSGLDASLTAAARLRNQTTLCAVGYARAIAERATVDDPNPPNLATSQQKRGFFFENLCDSVLCP